MDVVFFLLPWLIIGAGVIFVAFSGGPRGAHEAYLTGGTRGFRAFVLAVYIAFGVAIPAYVIGNSEAAVGGSGALANEPAEGQIERGKTLFQSTCASCHNLGEAGAMGNTGPDLDNIGAVTQERIENAIKIGGTGQNRMPAELLEGENAEAVAAYVAKVAGHQ